MKLRAGIVGCGRIGCGFDDDPRRKYVSTHARAYLSTEGVELAALCDTDYEKRKRYGAKFGVSALYADYNSMLQRERLDIVSICTPSSSHLEIASAAVACGVRGIFCEKPIADSVEAAEGMIRLCAAKDVVLLVDHQRRFDPMHQRLSKYVRDEGMGQLHQVTCYYTAGIANTGTHLFDLLRLYAGEIAWAEGRVSACASRSVADPNIDGWLELSCGALAAIQACDVSAYTIFEMNLLGTKGRLRIGSHGFRAEFEEARESERYSGYRELFPALVPVEGKFTQELLPLGVRHLIDCMQKRAVPVSSGEDGRAALEIICALSQSALECGKRVSLPQASAAPVPSSPLLPHSAAKGASS
jgi:predicted dehydrogenase